MELVWVNICASDSIKQKGEAEKTSLEDLRPRSKAYRKPRKTKEGPVPASTTAKCRHTNQRNFVRAPSSEDSRQRSNAWRKPRRENDGSPRASQHNGQMSSHGKRGLSSENLRGSTSEAGMAKCRDTSQRTFVKEPSADAPSTFHTPSILGVYSMVCSPSTEIIGVLAA